MNTLVKGSVWRRKVSEFLDAAGFLTVPRGLGFAGDDITASRLPLVFSVEAKNTKAFAPSEWVDQAAGNAPSGSIPMVVAHRRGKASVEDAYVIMTGAALLALLELVPLNQPLPKDSL